MIVRTVLMTFLASAPAALATDASDLSAVEAWQADPTAHVDAAEIDLAEFRWLARPIIVFADTPADPRFREQIELLNARPEELSERDVVVIVDTSPADRSPIRTKLRPRGFMLALVGKDGSVKLRKPLPWDIRELSRTIDKMPMRKQEIRDRAVSD